MRNILSGILLCHSINAYKVITARIKLNYFTLVGILKKNIVHRNTKIDFNADIKKWKKNYRKFITIKNST